MRFSQEVAERFYNRLIAAERGLMSLVVIHVVFTMSALGSLYPQLRL